MLSGRVARAVRGVASLAPLVRVVPRPSRRPEGVSALVRVHGEPEWLEPCLRSIAGFADEVLVLDNGAGPAALRQLEAGSRPLGPRVRRIDCAGVELPDVANRGLDASRYRWAFLWDSDFVARTEGPAAIERLKAFLGRLDPRRYHLVQVRALELAGDLGHRFPDLRERYDPHVLTAGGPARYVWRTRRGDRPGSPWVDRLLRDGADRPIRLRYDTLRTPKYYRVLRFGEPCLFHLNVKSARRTLLRQLWLEWLGADQPGGLEAYARRRAQERWGTGDLDAAAERFMVEYCRGLERVDEAALGGYPSVLRSHRERPAFRVLYRDGQIAGRAESAVPAEPAAP